jgi:hypothetical protein
MKILFAHKDGSVGLLTVGRWPSEYEVRVYVRRHDATAADRNALGEGQSDIESSSEEASAKWELAEDDKVCVALTAGLPETTPADRLTNVTALFSDLPALLTEIGSEDGARTLPDFLAELTGASVQRKVYKAQWANAFLKEKTALVLNLKAAAIAVTELANVRAEANRRLLDEQVAQEKASVELLKLQAERLRLEEQISRDQALKETRLSTQTLAEETKRDEIADQEALRKERVKTERLQEKRRRAGLKEEKQPEPEPKAQNEAEKVVDGVRQRLRTRAAATQNLISDFLEDAQKLYRSNMPDAEKAVRVHAILHDYNQHFSALPQEIQDLVNSVEGQE